MGCFCDLAQVIYKEATKINKRKTLKSFSTGNDIVIRVIPIEKHKKVALVMESNKMVFLDYSAEKMKVKYEAQLGPVEVLSYKFIESSDTLEFKYLSFTDYILFKFKVTADKITEISKDVVGKVPKSNDPKIEKIKGFENGNSVVFRPNEFQTSEDKYLSYVDKNFKVLGEVEIEKKLNLAYSWSNDKYVALTEYTTQQWMGQYKTISQAIHLYKLDNFSKVGVMEIEKVNGKFLEVKKVFIFPANDQSLLISLYGFVYVVDINTMKVKKKINFGEEKSVTQIVKDKKENNIFYAMSENGNLYKFNLDGSVLLKNNGPCLISFDLINDQKEIISDNLLCGVVIQSLTETE